MVTPVRKFSGDKSPRVRAADTALGDVAVQGPLADAGFTMPVGTVAGVSSDSATGDLEALVITGPSVVLMGGYLDIAADALTTDGLGQFAPTTSDDFAGVVPTTGLGDVVRNTSPALITPRVQGQTGFGFLTYVTLQGDGIANAIVNVPSANGDTLVGRNTIDTLTNKTLTTPVINGATGDQSLWTIGTDQFIKTTAGYIGIGTASPGDRLHVLANVNGNGGAIIANASSGASAQTVLYIDTVSNNGFQVGQTNATGNSFFYLGDNANFDISTNATLRMRFTGSGEVGVGNITPTSTFTVDGSVALGRIVTETAATHTLAATTTHLIANRAGTITVTLPAASSFPNRVVWIRTITANTVVSASSNVVPRAGGAAGTAILAATAGNWAMLVSDATNWQIQAGS